MKTFENSIREVVAELTWKAIEYKECSTNELNGDYFKGKSEAYYFAVKHITRAFDWHGLTVAPELQSPSESPPPK